MRGRNIFRRIRFRIAEEYYRQRFTQEAYQAMLDNNNSYLTMGFARTAALQVADANAGRGEEAVAGQATVERVKEDGGLIAGEVMREAGGELKAALVNEIIRPVFNGTMNADQVQQALRQFVETHQGDPIVTELFGTNATVYGVRAEYFATDLFDMGTRLKADFDAHGIAETQLAEAVTIKLANTQWAAQTAAHHGRQDLSRTDRFIRWAQQGRVRGAIFNPAFVGAASSIATFVGLRVPGVALRTANIIAPGTGMLTGGFFAAFRRNYDLKVDRTAHQVEMAYNMQIPDGARRRGRIERYAYNTVTVDQLLNGGGR